MGIVALLILKFIVIGFLLFINIFLQSIIRFGSFSLHFRRGTFGSFLTLLGLLFWVRFLFSFSFISLDSLGYGKQTWRYNLERAVIHRESSNQNLRSGRRSCDCTMMSASLMLCSAACRQHSWTRSSCWFPATWHKKREGLQFRLVALQGIMYFIEVVAIEDHFVQPQHCIWLKRSSSFKSSLWVLNWKLKAGLCQNLTAGSVVLAEVLYDGLRK